MSTPNHPQADALDYVDRPIALTQTGRDVAALAKVLRPALWLLPEPGPATMQERAIVLGEAMRAIEAGYVTPEEHARLWAIHEEYIDDNIDLTQRVAELEGQALSPVTDEQLQAAQRRLRGDS